MSDPNLNEQVAEIVTEAVEKIIRLLGRDDVEIPDVDSVTAEVPTVSRPAPVPRRETQPRVKGSRDPILDNFLGVGR